MAVTRTMVRNYSAVRFVIRGVDIGFCAAKLRRYTIASKQNEKKLVHSLITFINKRNVKIDEFSTGIIVRLLIKKVAIRKVY